MKEKQKAVSWTEIGRVVESINFSPKNLASESAWIGHLSFANWITREVKPRIFVELGTHAGTSYFAFCQSVMNSKLSTKCFAVDSWAGDEHAGFYSEEVYSRVKTENEQYKGFSTLVRKSFDDAIEVFQDNSIDILHIDGLHTYDAVKHDFYSWLPKLSPDAYVIFHDTNVHERDFGVHKFWNEIENSYNSIEFFHAHGLGIIQLGDTPHSLIPSEKEEQGAMREFFNALSQITLAMKESNVLAAENDRLRSENTSLISEQARLEKSLVEINTSLSWRVTSGLRRVSGMLRFPKS